MAGTVAKFAPYANLHDEFVVRQTSMEEEDLVLNLLDDESFAKRTQALDYLRGVVRKNGGRLVFHNRQALFNGLANLLQDSNWNVRHQCIQLISEMIPGFGPGLDAGMAAVLPNIVFNIGDTKVAIKKSAIQTVHLYLKHSLDRKLIFNALVKHGLENEDPRIGRETVVALPMMLTPEFAKEDLFPLTLALARKLHGRPDEDPKKILYSMDRIRSLVGDNKFEMWVSKFPTSLQGAYHSAYDPERNGFDTPKHDSVKSAKYESPSREGREVDLNASGHFKDFPDRHQVTSTRDTNHVRPMVAHRLGSHDDGPFEFGIIPSHVMQQLVDQEDWRIRAQGIEQLKNIMASLRDATPLLPQLLPFISFLCNLLDDVNFKITTVTLEIFGLLVDKLNLGVKPYLKPIVSALTKRLGDLKFVIKQENLRVLMQLMNILSPKPILSHLYEGLDHKNSRVREETLNVIIASLLTFPTYEFDLGALCEIVAPTLADAKPRVRQAALEAFAVLAQSMGPGRLQPLVSAVDSVELGRDGDGVMAAVQARLARRQLPRLGTDGLVEYATPPPASARSRSSTGSSQAHQGADTEWILNAPGAQGSSSSARDRPESDDFLSRSTPGPLPSGGIDGITPQPRRYFSAGRARNKLPWEEGRGDKEEEGNFHNSHPSSAPATQVPRPKQEMQPPIKPKNTWGFGEDEGSDVSGKRGRRRGKGYNGRDDSPNSGSQPTGSYKKEYLKKLEYNARAATLSGSHPRGRVVPLEQDSAPSSATVTPASDKAGVITNSSMSSPKKRREQRDAEEPSEGTNVRNESPLGHHYIPSFVDKPRDEERSRNQRASLSNSWPHQSRDFADMPKPKKSQDPLSALDSSLNISSDRLEASEDSPRYKGKEPARENQTPIPMKPALARSASKRRNKVIPPIPTSGEPSPREGDELDSGRDSSYVPTSNREHGHAEPEIDMESSLRQIRNSASKKRAQKLVNSMSETSLYSSLSAASSRSPSPPSSSLDDSGLFSPMSTLPLDEDANSTPKTTPKRKGKSGAESPFGSKPIMARRASAGRRRSPPTEGDFEQNTEPNPFEYQPNSGVTFRDKPSSDVSVVGQRMSYSNVADASEPRPEPVKKASPPLASPTLPSRPAPPKGNDMRDRKKQKGSPMPGMASMQHPGAADVDDGGNINNDHVVIVGRGMLSGSTSNMDTTEPLVGDRASPPLRKRSNQDDREEPPSGVYGVGMRQGGNDDYDSDFDEEDPNNISMSRATRERLNSKQQQRKEEIRAEKRAERERQELERREKRRLEREQKQREQEEWERIQREEQEKQERERRQREKEENEKRRREREEKARRKAEKEKEKERQKEKLRQSSQMELEDIGGLSIMGTGPYDRARMLDSSPVGKPPAHTPKKRGSQSPKVGSSPSTPSSQVSTPSHRSSSLMDELDLKPFNNPDAALQDAFRLVNDENWEVKCEGISHIRRLAIFHPKVVNSRLHDAILAVLTEVKNLRSSVARAAIACLGDMFTHLKKNMDQDIDQTTQVLLHKNGESNGFIREDVDKAMAALAMNVSAQRALTALIAAGRDHRNVAVRKCTAQYLVTIVERMGTGRVMSGIKDITDKVLPAASVFACDSSVEIRYYGKKILYQLMSHEDFDKLLVKHVAPKHLKDVQNKVEELRQRGLGEMPSDTPSARHRRAESGGSRAKSGSRDSINSPSSTLSTPTSSAKKKSPRAADTGLEECKELFGLLDSRDWQQRNQGIQQLVEMCEAGHPAVFNNLVKVFDRFAARLTDSNTKVNLFALQALRSIIQQVGPSADVTVVNALVPQMVSNLASKNQQIYNTAKDALNAVVRYVDKGLLLQPFANSAQYGNARVKPDMIDKLSDLVLEVYVRKQQSVVRHVLPVLWHLLGNTTSSGALPGGTGNIRDATNRLANSLHLQMGDALLEYASSLTPRNLQTLKDMLANPVQQ
ncbi:TOG array regulator of axonemal microtubules protein 1-like isoform X2 [Branchiostoma lanceolatum]|uniref:TOGARAM1 protein n=1 Tax=Branchiostoma lanceolatum TaxID=7740 RepID=A0A8J9ZWG7_BRALA|nr:TOGARAM1 [Branchiostoma lanceolatum]